MAINIWIDRIPCKTCGKLHPTLLWHKYYDEYVWSPERLEYEKQKRPKLLGNLTYEKYITQKKLIYSEVNGICKCGKVTHFKDIKTGKYVCSDKCRIGEENDSSL